MCTNDNFSRFLAQFRPTSGIEKKDLELWINRIAPSCVYSKGDSFECTFCYIRLSSKVAIRRHYKEQHFTQIPKDIFGKKTIFKCDLCDIEFVRKEHFLNHQASSLHSKNFILDLDVRLND